MYMWIGIDKHYTLNYTRPDQQTLRYEEKDILERKCIRVFRGEVIILSLKGGVLETPLLHIFEIPKLEALFL